MTDERLVDVGTLAEALNLTERRVTQLVLEGMPKHARGEYPLDDCLRWYIRYMQQVLVRKAIMSPDGEWGSAPAKLRRETAEAGIKEIELAKLRGEMVAIADVEKEMADLIVATKARILAVPARSAAELVGVKSRIEAQRIVDTHLREALRQLEAA